MGLKRGLAATLAVLAALLLTPGAGAAPPRAIAALGDSLSTGFGSGGTLANRPAGSWSTGEDAVVNSHYQRVARLTTAIFGNAHNDAASGAKMAAVPAQAAAAVSQGAGYVTLLAGTNDVCLATTTSGMTSVASFGASLDQALATLANGLPADGEILVASIPDWLKLREAFKDNASATAAWAANSVCPLIFDPATSASDRAAADQRIRDYNARAQAECAEVAKCTYDGGAVFALTFGSADLAPDFFHPSAQGQAKLAAVTWGAGPYASTTAFYDALSKPPNCPPCLALYEDPTLTSTIGSASNSKDFAFGSKDFGGPSGAPGRVFLRTVFSLAPGQTLGGKLHILRVLQSNGSTIYDVFLTAGREIRITSSAGGLSGSSFTLGTRFIVPNDGSTTVIEVSGLRNDSLTIRVNGVNRASRGALSGATSGNQRYLNVGITRYDGTATNSVQAKHAFVATSTTDWIGPPAGGGDETPPAVPAGLTATATGSTTVALDWTSNSDADLAGYNVYRSATQNGTYAKLNGPLVTTSNYVDAAAPSDATSFYKVTAVDGSDNESALSAVASATTPPADDMGPYEEYTIDGGCSGCSLTWNDPELTATIAGADDQADTAVATDDVGGPSGLSGRVFTRTVFRLAPGQTLAAQLYVFHLADTSGREVFSLFVNQSRILRLSSPAGGLQSTSINASTGVTVPNDGTPVVIEVSALRDDSVVVRVDGVDRIDLGGLAGATTANPRNLSVGILRYSGTSTAPVTVHHANVGVSTSDWLGVP